MPTEHNRHEEQYMLRSSRESARHVESLEDGSSDSQAAGSNDPHTSSRVISTPSPSQVIYRLLPAKFRWILNSIVKWSQGPIPPRPFRIKSLAPKIQSIPKRLADSLTRYILIHWLIVWSLICGILFIFILARSETSCQIHSYGSPLRLSCVSRLW